MSDQLNQKELERARSFAKREGVAHAAQKLGVSRQALLSALAVMPVRAGTISLIRENLEGAISVVRGDVKSTVKREA